MAVNSINDEAMKTSRDTEV